MLMFLTCKHFKQIVCEQGKNFGFLSWSLKTSRQTLQFTKSSVSSSTIATLLLCLLLRAIVVTLCFKTNYGQDYNRTQKQQQR